MAFRLYITNLYNICFTDFEVRRYLKLPHDVVLAVRLTVLFTKQIEN